MSVNYGFKVSLLSEEDGGGYLIEVPELPGCMTDGDTVEEALAKLPEVIDLWVTTAREIGKPVPVPRTYESNNLSGKFTVRVPKDLHKELAVAAEEQGVSLNQLVGYYLAKSVAKEPNNIAATKTVVTLDKELRKSFEEAIRVGTSSINQLWRDNEDFRRESIRELFYGNASFSTGGLK